jgi:valyl-tRNA synthetase
MNLPKTYEPGQYETDIYALWEKSGVFVADPKSKKKRFSISMPPPNETGTLSIGHALFLTLQDIMARHARQQGKDVLWLPGTDHAALAVNAIIEKKLAEEGTNKHAVGREVFLARTRDFVATSRGTMLLQMRAMGASCDWTRLRYTLDDSLSRCVNEVFLKMYRDGLIYRGYRIVNWDPNLETTVSDDEVSYRQETTPFYTFEYGPFQISTARPETKFGDKYVVMHPDDKRYAQYKHGDTFTAEWINGPVIATVIKDAAVDASFGTGVMTITPWHDHTDFEIAERHHLDKEQIIDFHGRLLPIASEFAGMPILDARPKIVEKLRKKGLLVTEDTKYIHNIAINERGKGTIEPQIKLQWFVDVNKPTVKWQGKSRSLKEVLQAVIHDGDITLVPERFNKTYFNWIDNLRDWCISRQIWWGHRIPIWYRTHADGQVETYAGLVPPIDDGKEGWRTWEQDPDTLDTWFSSALWTWSTLVDPTLAVDYSLSLNDILAKSPDFQAYHPTTIMETGWDILFFWVARMILSTTYATGQVPFKTVYLHGLIRAEDGKKMSKSRPESIIDPLDVIPKYGTDALRMALIMGVTPGNDQSWGWSKIEANRNFCNKLWNIARYSEGLNGEVGASNLKPKTDADHWILSKLQRLANGTAEDIENLRFSEAYEKLYHFVWDDLADWYVEASKAAPNAAFLQGVLRSVLIIAHPFAPFVTETIWQTFDIEEGSVLARELWPDVPNADEKRVRQFAEVQAIVSEARFITTSVNVTDATLYYSDVPFLAENAGLIKRLAHLVGVKEVRDGTGLYLTNTSYRCWLDIDQATAKQFSTQLRTKLEAQQAVVTRLKERLANAVYVSRAPKVVVEDTKQQLVEAEAQVVAITKEYERFQ